MKIRVKFYGNLRHLANRPETDVVLRDRSTVGDALQEVAEIGHELRKRIFDQAGDLSRFLVILRNGRQIALQDAFVESLVEGDTLDLLPPIGGG